MKAINDNKDKKALHYEEILKEFDQTDDAQNQRLTLQTKCAEIQAKLDSQIASL